MKKILFLLITILIFSSCATKKNIILNSMNQNYQSFVNNENDSKFSLVVIPDSQSYVDFRAQKSIFSSFPINQKDIYYEQMKFIAEHSVSNNGDFSAAIHVGDQVDHRAWNILEWKYAKKGLNFLKGKLPILTVIGNHDYDVWKKNKRPSGTFYYKSHFGPKTSFFKNKEWFGGASKNKISTWIRIPVCNKELLIIGLELDPTDETLNWAQQIINNNKGLPTIIVTHNYIGLSGNYTSPYPEKKNHKNSANEVWEKLIKSNNQIFCILCGHVSAGDKGVGFRVDENDYGNKTYTILSDFQTRSSYMSYFNISSKKTYDCGDGWLRILNFDLEENTLHVQTYSTLYDRYELDSQSDFNVDIDLSDTYRFYTNKE